MYSKLILFFFVTSASAGFMDVIANGFSNLVSSFSHVYKPKPGLEDGYLSINQLAAKYGYPMEVHTVITEDGYILNMHRIPHGRNGNSNGRAVFVMHGIWESSDSWLLQGPGKALACLLADEGYDVWLGNARGNRHSSNHVNLMSNMSKFWEFSWDEIGTYDLPAMIDYTLAVTGRESLYYAGFSQGTTTFLVMNSMRPEYNRKIKMMFALAPEAFLGNATNIILKIFSPVQSYLQYFLWNFNIYSPSTEFFNRITPFLCSITSVKCDNIFFSMIGPNNVNETLWPVILGHTPTGSSTLQFIHYAQLANSGRFCRFDYGREKNIENYGQETPPDYDLSKVTVPIILYHSGNDWFSDRRDIELLKDRLPNVVKSYYVPKFTHVDFMYAAEASTLIYANIIKHIENGTDIKLD